MKKVSVKIPAKINLTLDILGRTADGYHDLKSLVASIDIFDKITLKKRKDVFITIKEKGNKTGLTEENNAYKTARRFMEKYDTAGVDITIDKRIPIANGLGGSSADIAAVLIAMKKLFKVDCDLNDLAKELGSDVCYMLNGGLTIIEGKGDKAEYSIKKRKLFLNIITNKQPISSKESYAEFDKQHKMYDETSENCAFALINNNYQEFVSYVKNDLYNASIKFVPDMEEKITALKESGADVAVMTGSGSAVYGIYADKKARNNAYKTLFMKYGDEVLKKKTI